MGITMIKFLLKAWDDIEAYQDHSAKLHSVKLHSKEVRLVKLRSNPNLHPRNTLFWLKKWLEKGIAGIVVWV